jgi:sugar phosphate isomerase/epimerase
MCTGHDDTAGREEVARLSRRGFLRTTVTTAAVVGTSSALAAPALAQEGTAGSQGHSRHRVPRDQISIQLYTLRDQLAIDLGGTIAALAAIGYTKVEHAGFVGRTVQQFKAVLDANGIVSTSGHVPIPQPFDPAAWSASLADATTLGSRYIVHPFFGIDFATGEVTRTTAPWRAFARDLNRAGRMAQGRVLQYHVKDMNQAGSFEDPGQGLLDFARIFRHTDEAGVREYIVERDDAGTPPRQPADALDTARVGYQFLRTVRF